MKRIGYLYEKLIDVEYLESCIHRAFRKKKKTVSRHSDQQEERLSAFKNIEL